MQVDFDTLKRYEEDGRLRHSVHPDRDLHAWCYAATVPYSRDWDEITMLCRGLVTDGQGVVLSRPFRKFFNWGEPLAPGPDVTETEFWAYDKEDGTMIVVGLDANGDRVVSTKGSFTTWHSAEAEKMLGDWMPHEGSTAIFEFIHPDNKIVVDYDGYAGLVLIGAVNNESGADHFRPERYAETSLWDGRIALERRFNLQAMLNTVADPENGPNREGFVLVWPRDGGPSPRAKIKFAQYVHLHAVLSRLSNVAVWEALKTGTFDAVLEIVPDEVYDKVRECADELQSKAQELHKKVEGHVVDVVMSWDSRKDQAKMVLANWSEESALVFGLLDGKDIWPKVWDRVRPERDTTWTFLK